MEEQAREDLDDPELRRLADLRYRRQRFELTVEADDLDALAERFGEAHERATATGWTARPSSSSTRALIATVAVERPELSEPEPDGEADAGTRKANFDGDWQEVAGAAARRDGRGLEVEGPAIVEFAEATCVVRPGWTGAIDAVGTLVLERDRCVSLDPVTLSVLASALVGHRRGDGRGADPRRLLLEHQGAPRLLGRAVRRRGPHGRPGRAHPRAPRRHAGGGRGGDRARARARRRLDPQRPLPRRHASARHHARCRRSTSTATSSATRSRARTTPTSAACAPARCPPTRARSGRRAS